MQYLLVARLLVVACCCLLVFVLVHRGTVNMKILQFSKYGVFPKFSVFLIIVPEIFNDFFPACT
mgnify:CR=1 FL=1